MATPLSELHCEVLTPEGAIYKGAASMVIVPGADGELGILPKHAPLISSLGKGRMRIKTGDSTQSWEVDGGFVEVLDNKVSVLAEKVTPTT